MFNWKNIVIAVLMFSNSAVYSGTMGVVCAVEEVTMPCDLDAWDFGMRALYLIPSYAANTFPVPQIIAPGAPPENQLNPDWGWGFKIEGSHHFGAGNDINVNWYHYSKITDNTLIASLTEGSLSTISTEFKPKWDAVNAEFGQRIDVGPLKSARLHAGVQYARISHDYYVNVVNLPPTDYLHTKFNGFGPRIGVDLSYKFAGMFKAYINTAAATLVGKRDYNTATTGILDTLGSATASKNLIVSELEAKLGINAIFGLAQGNLIADAGYMWQDYFNAQSFRTVSNLTGTSNFAVCGGYVGLKYIGYV